MPDRPRVAREIDAGRAVLVAAELVDAFGHLSARLDGRTYLITPARDLGDVTGGDLIPIDLQAQELPPDAPAETHLHSAIYRARPDAGAICRAQPRSSLAAGALTRELRPLHGQAAWLGTAVPVHQDARLVRAPDLAAAAAHSLNAAQGMVLRGNGAVTVGGTAGLAVARMAVLEAACSVWLQATAAGDPRWLSAEEIAGWQRAEPELLGRLWRHLERRHLHPQ